MNESGGTSLRSVIGGAILAGGTASRMHGIAKGLIQIGECSLMQRLIHQLHASSVRECIIVANHGGPYLNLHLPVVSDFRQEGIGPLAGIESGLNYFAERCHGVLFLSCDLPEITADELNTLIKAFRESTQPVVFAQTGVDDWHPLCAVAHVGILPALIAAIDSGERAVRDFWCQVGAERVPFADETRFFNINRLDDLEQWRKQTRDS